MSSKAIVVGTSACLLENKRGKDIDAFDYVMRSARCFTDNKFNLWKDYTGVKTSLVWVTYYHLDQIISVPEQTSILLLFQDPDYYIEPNHIASPYHAQERVNRIYYDNTIKRKKNIYHYIGTNLYNNMLKNVKFKFTNKAKNKKIRLSAGIQALNYALCNFKEVYITGFDHFKTGYYFDKTAISYRQSHDAFLEACYVQSLIKSKTIHRL